MDTVRRPLRRMIEDVHLDILKKNFAGDYPNLYRNQGCDDGALWGSIPNW